MSVDPRDMFGFFFLHACLLLADDRTCKYTSQWLAHTLTSNIPTSTLNFATITPPRVESQAFSALFSLFRMLLSCAIISIILIQLFDRREVQRDDDDFIFLNGKTYM